MLLLVMASPIFAENRALWFLSASFFFVTLVGGIYALSGSRKFLYAGWILMVLSLVAHFLTIFSPNLYIGMARVVFSILFFGLVAVTILKHIFLTTEISEENLLGAICVYLILGISWGLLFTGIELLNPHSFEFPVEVTFTGSESAGHDLFSNLIYYSFVTLSTLGYGDITPISPIARVFSYMEAITGQIYLAVIIATLVGIHIGSKISESFK